MKRIVDGVTYNTDTSTKIAAAEWDNTGLQGGRGEAVLYQTRGGAFFEVSTETVPYKDRDGEWTEREKTEVATLTREAAQKWILTGDVEVFSDVLGEPPEAAADEDQAAGSTLYIRLPSSLKDRIEARSKQESLSVNSWAIRCFENCAAPATSAAPKIARKVPRGMEPRR